MSDRSHHQGASKECVAQMTGSEKPGAPSSTAAPHTPSSSELLAEKQKFCSKAID